MIEFSEIEKECKVLKKRNAPLAEFEALFKRNAEYRERLFEKMERFVKGEMK